MPGPGFLSFAATTTQATLPGLNETLWMVVIGGVAAVLHSVTLGKCGEQRVRQSLHTLASALAALPPRPA